MKEQCFTVQALGRLDSLLAGAYPTMSRSQAQGLIAGGHVLVNGKPALKSGKPKLGDTVVFTLPEPVPIDVQAQDIPIAIVYEDKDLLVVNKPKGMVVHPAPGNYSGTLVNALLYHVGASLSGINGKIRPGIVHRIDKDTSGLLIVAKNDLAHKGLAAQIKAHSFKRAYRAVVYGNIKEETGTVDAPIGRNPKQRKQMAVLWNSPTAREARTHFAVVERLHGFTDLALRLETGRTHQIRVHMASLGHPVAGDTVYGPQKGIQALMGQCLHAGEIGFVHPVTGAYLAFTAPLPAYYTSFLEKLRHVSYG